MTGFWLANPPDRQIVLDAIKHHRTFATTQSDISLDWSYNEAKGIISWKVAWQKHDSSGNHGFTVEVYRGEQKLRTVYEDGELWVDKAGLYWIAVFDEENIAISSPITVSAAYPAGQPVPQNLTVLTNALRYIRTDLTCLNMTVEKALQPTAAAFSEKIELQMICSTETPHIVDVQGNPVPYNVISKGSPRVIIDKECGAREFEEFYLWFDRNEVHEYVFANMTYHKDDQTFFLTGHLLPKKLAHQSDIVTRYRPEIDHIRNIVDAHTRFKIHVSTLRSLVISLHLDGNLLPYKVFDDVTGLRSVLCYIAEDVSCPDHLRDHVRGMPYSESKPLQEKIYQIFV
jgi:hypothetical protein